jgi:hypothetical protein
LRSPRPFDPNAWFVLLLLTYPQAFNPGAIRWWIPAWLALRLYWHLAIQFLAPAALFSSDSIDRLLNPVFVWSSIFYIALYWVLLLDNLRTASSPDARRRLQVLLAGSIVGLGSILIVFGLLPYLGIADPTEIR